MPASPNIREINMQDKDTVKSTFLQLFGPILCDSNQNPKDCGFNNIGKTPGRLYLIDASTVSLCLSRYPWADYVNSKSGIKLHLRLVFHDGITIPDKAVVTPAIQTDKSIMQELIVEEKDPVISGPPLRKHELPTQTTTVNKLSPPQLQSDFL